MWIARNTDGTLYLWTVKPSPKDENNGYWQNPLCCTMPYIQIDGNMFPELTDEEPIEVELNICDNRYYTDKYVNGAAGKKFMTDLLNYFYEEGKKRCKDTTVTEENIHSVAHEYSVECFGNVQMTLFTDNAFIKGWREGHEGIPV